MGSLRPEPRDRPDIKLGDTNLETPVYPRPHPISRVNVGVGLPRSLTEPHSISPRPLGTPWSSRLP